MDELAKPTLWTFNFNAIMRMPNPSGVDLLTILKQTWTDFLDDNCTRIAAALSYSTAFSLAPMLVLIISVCQLVFEPEDIRGKVENEIAAVVGAEGAEQVKTMIDSSSGTEKRGVFATIIGIVVMLVGATGLFAQLQAAMNDVWEVRPDPDKSSITYFFKKRLLSLGMVLSISFLLIVSLVASTIVHAFDGTIDRWLPGEAGSAIVFAANLLISFGVLVGLFAAIFKVLPDADVRWSDVGVGATATALLFLFGKACLSWYLGSSNMTTTYGAAGSLVLILVWVYYSTLILLLGAEFTQAWAKHRGSGVVPSDGAVRVIKSTELQRP